MPNNSNSAQLNHIPRQSGGFTLIELMIVIAIIAVILTLALPVYSNYRVRAKIGEAISAADSAKTAVESTCTKDPAIRAINSSNSHYEFGNTTLYVATITLSGPCTSPTIRIQTQQTGAFPDPTIHLRGRLASGRMQFTCSTSGFSVHLPKECRG